MKKYTMFQRKSGYWYLQERGTKKQTSLKTKDKEVATKILNAKNDAARDPLVQRKVGLSLLEAADPEAKTRTWQTVMDEFVLEGTEESTRARKRTAVNDKAYDGIRNKLLTETTPQDLLDGIRKGGVATNAFLKRLHNLAFDMGWIGKHILPKRRWPAIVYKKKRAVTEKEHCRILKRERNKERRDFYDFLWHTGASQGDAAKLTRENVDWTTEIITIPRRKIKNRRLPPAKLKMGRDLKALVKRLPKRGHLFPYLATVRSGDRSTEFHQRCESLGIEGISLHSYRYAWSQRAKTCGYNRRYAMINLGHNTSAIHEHYAEDADVVIPPLEDVERAFKKKQKKKKKKNGRGKSK